MGDYLPKVQVVYYFQVVRYLNFQTLAKPAFDWSKQKPWVVSTCRIHVTNIKIFKIPLLTNQPFC